MKVYKFPSCSKVGKFIVIGPYQDRTLIYSISSTDYPRFYIIFNYIINKYNELYNEENEELYKNDIIIAYKSFRLIMKFSSNYLFSLNEPKKYENILKYQNSLKYQNLFDACSLYFESFIENEKIINNQINDITNQLEGQKI